MAEVSRFKDRAESQIEDILLSRCAPDDVIEWDLNIVPFMFEEVEDDDPYLSSDDFEGEEAVIVAQPSLAFFIAIDCPEVEPEKEGMVKSMAYVQLPAYFLSEEAISVWVNQVWDTLQFSRMSVSLSS